MTTSPNKPDQPLTTHQRAPNATTTPSAVDSTQSSPPQINMPNSHSNRTRRDRDKGWIQRLQDRQNRAKCHIYHPIIVRQGPIDTVIIGDSIIKYVDQIRHSQVISYPGINCASLGQLINRNKIPELEGKKVIVAHVGTNDLNMDWRDTVYCVSHLITILVNKYPRAHIIWSNILPRPAQTAHLDRETVRKNIITVNKVMKSRQRVLGMVSCPSHTSFHHSKHPIHKLFARDFLHLKTKGTFLLRELYRQHLLRLRDLWGITTWPVNEIPDPETRIEWNWMNQLCANNTSR